ncbi:MAG: trypsin-like serine peptidase, partial [Oceanococcaceae bacterium]
MKRFCRRRSAALALCAFWLGSLSLPLQAEPAEAPMLVLDPPSEQALLEARAQTRPWRFALPVAVDIAPSRDGSWAQQGQQLWQLQLHSPGAQSLSLHFDRWQLPEGARLSLRDAQGRQLDYGPEHGGPQGLWTAMLSGETLWLELRLPLGAPSPEMHLQQVFHGFRTADAALGFMTKAGSCNIDVACAEADGYRDQVRGTLLLQFAGGFSCSGVLINNTAQDFKPLVLTADHCGIDGGNDDSVVAYFNFERERCQTGLSDGNREQIPLDPAQSLSGAEFLAGDRVSDFTLLVLGSRQNPSAIPSAWEPYWVGWTRSLDPADFGASIHHPDADEKSIALFSDPLRPRTVFDNDTGVNVQTWEVVWSRGTTEPGSSGSGIFGPDGLLRGQLYGGGASCSAQSDPDYYGRFDVSWDGSPFVERHLRSWLDPNGVGANPTNLSGLNFDGSVPGPGATPAPRPAPGTPSPPGDGGGGSGALSLGWLWLALLVLVRRRWAAALLVLSFGVSAQESLYVLPPPTQQDLAEAQAQTRPWQFAVPVDVDLDIRRDGAWEAVGEERVWRLDLHSPGAHSLALHFDQWKLPPGAELRLRDLNSGQWVGPYSAERNPGPELWTALLRSDVIRLELRMPRAAAEPQLHVARAFHGFRDAVPTKAGSCNIDVACPEAEPFAEQARATVLVQISGSGSCSGTIVNNTAGDGLPLLLTADHCGID